MEKKKRVLVIKEITLTEFVNDKEIYTVWDDKFLKIRTEAGNAVLVSKDKWNTFLDAMKLVMASGSNQRKLPAGGGKKGFYL